MAWNKKAVSPLIATVLLIAFAVALGAIVMNWGESFVRETQETAEEASIGKIECTTKVSFEVVNAKYEEDGDDATFEALIRNTGDADIEEFVVQVFSNTIKGGTGNSTDMLPTLGVKSYEFDVTNSDGDFPDLLSTSSNVTEVRIFPRIDVGAATGPISCTNKYVLVTSDEMTIVD